MKKLTLSLLAAALISAAGGVHAWWGNGWGGGWNPYDPWDPRYWMEEFFGGGWGNGWGGPWGYGGYPYYGGYYGGPWGGYGAPWGGYGYPYYGGWGYGPYAVVPAQPKAKAKAEKAS